MTQKESFQESKQETLNGVSWIGGLVLKFNKLRKLRKIRKIRKFLKSQRCFTGVPEPF
jgi:hypothetical protein